MYTLFSIFPESTPFFLIWCAKDFSLFLDNFSLKYFLCSDLSICIWCQWCKQLLIQHNMLVFLHWIPSYIFPLVFFHIMHSSHKELFIFFAFLCSLLSLFKPISARFECHRLNTLWNLLSKIRYLKLNGLFKIS